MRFHVDPRDRPTVKRSFRKGHDLGAPDVGKASVRPGDDRGVGGSKRLDPRQLADVTERKVGAERPLLGEPSRPGRYRLVTDALDIGRRPPLLICGREPLQGRLQVRFEGAADINDGDLLRGIGRQSQGGPCRPRTRSDDQRGRHVRLRWSANWAPSSPPPTGTHDASRSAWYSQDISHQNAAARSIRPSKALIRLGMFHLRPGRAFNPARFDRISSF